MAIEQPFLPNYVDTAIIGAGPHALTLAAHLLKKSKKFYTKFLVFDPAGTWLSQWTRQFKAFQIPHLRSPVVHHPEPNAFALRAFAEKRQTELFPPYDLPGTEVFQDFCAEVVQRWQLTTKVYPSSITHLEILPQGYRLWLDADRSIRARRVALAHRGGIAYWPTWAIDARKSYSAVATSLPDNRLQHSSQIDLGKVQVSGEHILIVGGGLTSGHLAVGAIQAGAQVTMMHRRQFYDKLFDADPGWLGPTARNLSGARMASNRIVPALTKASICLAPRT